MRHIKFILFNILFLYIIYQFLVNDSQTAYNILLFFGWFYFILCFFCFFIIDKLLKIPRSKIELSLKAQYFMILCCVFAYYGKFLFAFFMLSDAALLSALFVNFKESDNKNQVAK